MDTFFLAGQMPRPADGTTLLARPAHYHCRGVVQIMAKCTLAELLIVAGIENEVVPQLIHHLRRHRHRLFVGLQRTTEKLPQPCLDQRQLFVVKRRISLAHTLQQAGRQLIRIDELLPPLLRAAMSPERSSKAEKSQRNQDR